MLRIRGLYMVSVALHMSLDPTKYLCPSKKLLENTWLEFRANDLMVHMFWEDGQWVG